MKGVGKVGEDRIRSSARWEKIDMDQTLVSAFALPSRTAVVTGAGSGLGQAIARCLAMAGARVVVSDVSAEGMAATCALIAGDGREATSQPCDVRDRVQLAALAQAAVDRYGGLDIWVNVAGVVVLSPLLETDTEAGARLMAVNALGVQLGCMEAARVMKDRGGGVIVNISSAGASLPVPGMSTYCMSKAAVNQLTRVSALELGPYGIRVNAIAPGWIETPMASAVFRGPDGEIDQAARQAYIAQQVAASPLGITGAPQDVALAALYLASDASRFVTGQVLTVNGGISF